MNPLGELPKGYLILQNMQKARVTLQAEGCGNILFISLKAILHLVALLVLHA